MKHFKIKPFVKEAKKEKISDQKLLDTIEEFEQLDVDGKNRYSLGGTLYKLRLASNTGSGKSGGSRSILAYKKNDIIYWLHLFAKNDKGNVTTKELADLKKIAKLLFNYSDKELAKLIKDGVIVEVKS
ncbi:type II toxin-antitoxin system RelE/ParE family toxin [Thiotrichales bacterium 19S3-7]|nr:type II toxin-antitoxin system RelE/ParE family toxin [Thiotrichales bacterium 19S3-7]MCF6803058.1 type II toxin-antitoxin system RelE/ParE family toxin [Thiotrichales bacterium 19S3-11]